MKIGIDLGGSHIGIGLVNNEGKIVQKQETDLKTKKAGETIKFIENYILQSIQTIIKTNDIELIGIASPGNVTNEKINSLVNLGIQELDIAEIIKKQYKGKIQVKNDAKCAALAEKKYGSLKNIQDAVFLCLGTGIGGSFFLQGKQFKPIRNSGFEIGHMIIKKDGKKCKCGKKGCFETYCSIKRLKNVLIQTMNLNKEISAKELIEILNKRKEEKKVQQIINEYIENLIIGLSNIIDILEPQAISLGGSFVYFENVLYKKLIEKYYSEKYVFNKIELPELKLASLGNDAGIIGATL